MGKDLSLHSDQQYLALLSDIKDRLKTAQLKAAIAVNRELLQLYWQIGKRIIELQAEAKWGDKLLDTLEKDLRSSFPELQGFSKTNLKNKRLFAEIYPSFVIGQTVSDQLTWSHQVALLRHTNSVEERQWYVQQIIEKGWSFRILQDHLKAGLYGRQAVHSHKSTNFQESRAGICICG